METNFPGWVHFWGKLVLASAGAGIVIGWNVVAKTIIDSLKIDSYTDDVARTGAGNGAAFFKTLSNAGKRATYHRRCSEYRSHALGYLYTRGFLHKRAQQKSA